MHAGIHSEYKTLHSGDEDRINRHKTVRTSLIEPSWPKEDVKISNFKVQIRIKDKSSVSTREAICAKIRHIEFKAGFPLANIFARSDFFPLSLSFRLKPSGTN